MCWAGWGSFIQRTNWASKLRKWKCQVFYFVKLTVRHFHQHSGNVRISSTASTVCALSTALSAAEGARSSGECYQSCQVISGWYSLTYLAFSSLSASTSAIQPPHPHPPTPQLKHTHLSARSKGIPFKNGNDWFKICYPNGSEYNSSPSGIFFPYWEPETVQDVLAEMEATFAQCWTIISFAQIVLKRFWEKESKRKIVHRKKRMGDRDKVRGGTRKRKQYSSFHSNLARWWFRSRALTVNPQIYCSDLNAMPAIWINVS